MEGLYSRSMLVDRSWMERRIESHGCSVTQQFREGVEHFMNFAYSNAQFVTGVTIKCPCHKCALLKFQDRETSTVHLYSWGFLTSYTTWSEHGEASTSDVNEPDVPRDKMQRVTENRYREMVIDAAGPDLRDFFEREAPNSNATKFFELLRCADEPLWDGCQNHNRLSAVSLLMNVKSECNMSESCYNRVISAVKSMLPKDASFPDDFYQSKKMLKKLVLSYVKIHACPNDCMLFWKEHADKKKCIVCGHLRFKKGKEGRGKARTEVPFKVLRYLPLAPRLQRLFMSNKTAKYMSWHKYDRRPEGVLTHPSDGEAWKHIDRVYPLFAAEERNVRLGLSTDGFNPFGHKSKPYSCWPVFVTPYNLPPWMCMKEEVLFLTLIIPGPQSPGKNIDVYLRPLIDELKMLWHDGIDTYDVSREQNFKMRAILLWTISDFPAYGMLSGWSTHGKMSCPYCMEKTKTFTLKSGGKPTFFDCHRQFLPLNHPYRKDKDKFFVGRVEKSKPPPRLSGDDLLKRLSKFPRNTFGKLVVEQKWPGYGKDHNWTKKSIFWELPYWSKNLIRHNLDVMHIEKNAFENVFNTVMDVKGKTKDNIKSREDLKRYCKRPNLNMFEQGGKLMKPKAPFTLSKSEIRTLCEWIKQLKFPDGYSSNISKCVNLDDCKLYGLKSHDCHVFMERLIPIAFREMLPKSIWDTLTELSHYFRDICSTVMHVQHLHTLEINIVEILCKLEKIFPPSFFDSMEHLAIHLAYEAKVGGPNQYRWMYPFERCMMSLKRKVRNKASIEGSICEAYLIQETSNFCSLYFEPHIQTRLNRVPRNDDGGRVGDDNKLSIFTYPCRPYGATIEICMPEDEYKAAEIYVLLNCPEIMPFVEEFDNMMLENNQNMKDGELDQLREKEFADWVRQRVCQDTTVDVRIRDMCNGPRKYVTCYNCCFVNGFKFHTKEYGQHKTTINSGVCIKGNCYNEFEKDYYGTLESVIQLHYVGGNRVTLFKCLWYDTERGVKVDSKHGLVDINIKSKLGGNDPFVLAEQAHQVYYTTYPARKRRRTEWWAVSKTKARSTYIISEGLQDDEVAPTIECFYQEDETSPPVIVEVDVELDQAIGLPTNEVEDVGPAQVSTTSIDDLNVDEDLELDQEEESDDEFSEEESDDFELSSSDSE